MDLMGRSPKRSGSSSSRKNPQTVRGASTKSFRYRFDSFEPVTIPTSYSRWWCCSPASNVTRGDIQAARIPKTPRRLQALRTKEVETPSSKATQTEVRSRSFRQALPGSSTKNSSTRWATTRSLHAPSKYCSRNCHSDFDHPSRWKMPTKSCSRRWASPIHHFRNCRRPRRLRRSLRPGRSGMRTLRRRTAAHTRNSRWVRHRD